MTLLDDAMTAYISGLATKLNEKEIWWIDDYGNKVTVELVNARWEKYIVRHYYNNGKLRWEYNYCKDLCHGPAKAYSENGILIIEENFKNDMRDGLDKVYYTNGKLKHEAYYKNGELNGLYKAYFKSGNLKFTQHYCDGHRHGWEKSYRNNKIVSKIKFDHGVLVE